jgi:hypothetical protein
MNEAGEGGAAGSGGDALLSNDAGPAVHAEVKPDDLNVEPEAPEQLAVSFPDNWKEGIPSEFREDPALKAIADVPTLVKSYLSAQKMVGRDKVVVPGKHATEDDWTSFFRKAGLPETLEEYEVTVPEGAQFEDGFISEFKETAFKSGMLPRQVNQLLSWYSEANSRAVSEWEQRAAQRQEEQLEALKQEWGQAFNDRVALAKRALNSSGIENVWSWIEDNNKQNDPMMVRLLAKFGEMLGEDKIVGEEAGSGNRTPADVQSEINEILGNPEHPVNVANHPNHQAAVKELQGLFNILHPN